jgi:prepilin-type N-terminal cleavage/methylation domain-containing protein
VPETEAHETVMATRRRKTGSVPRRGTAGFTLMEMMIVIGLVGLVAALALPSIVALFNAGADAQAYNLMASQLAAARALAIEKGTYAGVHVQLADALQGSEFLRLKLENVCYTALVLYNRQAERFRVHTTPVRVPGSIAFGTISEETVSGGNYSDGVNPSGKHNDFTTFTVIFSPTGSAVRLVDGQAIQFDNQDLAFRLEDDPQAALDIAGSSRLWQYPKVEPGVTAMTLFDVTEYVGAEDAVAYLNENGQFLPVNVHTGQLFPRE